MYLYIYNFTLRDKFPKVTVVTPPVRPMPIVFHQKTYFFLLNMLPNLQELFPKDIAITIFLGPILCL